MPKRGYERIHETYYEPAITRFFSWPKTTLFGNIFYRVQDVEQGYVRDKRARSNSRIARFGAGILYPIFTPIAFVFRKVQNLFSRDYQKVQACRDNAQEKKRILKAGICSQLELTLTPEQALETFDTRDNEILEQYSKLIKQIDSAEQWENPDIIGQFTNLFTQAAKNFSILVMAMRGIVAKNLPNGSPKDIAKRLVQQPLNRPKGGAFSHRFLFSSFIEMYHFARSKTYNVRDEQMARMYGEDLNTLYPRSTASPSHERAPEFYKADTPQAEWRRGYNTGVKLFFSQFGGNSFRPVLERADKRFDLWTRIDTSKNEDSFIPSPGTRPT